MSALPAQPSDPVASRGDDDVTRALRELAGREFRVTAPNPALPYHLMTYQDRIVVPIETVRDTLIENEDGLVWRDDRNGRNLEVGERLAVVKGTTTASLVLGDASVIPFVWIVDGLPLPTRSSEQVLATQSLEDVVRAVRALCIAQGGDETPDPLVASAVANGSAVESLLAERIRGGEGFARLTRAISHTLRDTHAVGNSELLAMSLNVTIDDLCDTAFLLPVLAVAAYEDWTMPTRRQTHGTGFAVDVERDESAAFGLRLVNIRPAVPFVALAPITSVVMRCRQGDRFVFDELVRQYAKWAVKNGIDIDILTRLAQS